MEVGPEGPAGGALSLGVDELEDPTPELLAMAFCLLTSLANIALCSSDWWVSSNILDTSKYWV